jgi:hypothetical protein
MVRQKSTQRSKLTVTTAFDTMIFERRSDLSPHTISDYIVTGKKVKAYFESDPVIDDLDRDDWLGFFNYTAHGHKLRFFCRSQPASARASCQSPARTRAESKTANCARAQYISAITSTRPPALPPGHLSRSAPRPAGTFTPI